jgi:N-acetylglucosamine-6-phosphate deacetylase
MNCFGFHWQTGSSVRVQSAGGLLASVEELIKPLDQGPVLAPGFIDIQVNGFAGADYCCGTTPLELIERSLHAQFACGVTRLLPTVITGAQDAMEGALRNLARARRELRHGKAIAGFHVEGPHISPHDGPRGAHPQGQVRPPSTGEFDRLQDAAEGNIRLVTLSPEWPGAPAFIEHVVRGGVVASLGHLDATPAQIEAAVSAGATLSTHLGNGAHSSLPRHPNYLWGQLAEDRLAASFIVDGIHLGADFLRVALRSKGLERAVLITDAVMPAGCAPGPYMLGEVEVELHAAGNVTLRGGDRLAGSALHMHRGVENLMRIAGLDLTEAITMATRNPARVARLEGRRRGLETGERADLVELEVDRQSRSLRVIRTWLDGETVYED